MMRKSIAAKLSLWVIATTLAIFALIFFYSYRYAGNILLSNSEQRAEDLAMSTVNRIEAVLVGVEKVAQNVAYSLENSVMTRDDVISLVRMVVERNGEVFGSAIAFEPFAFDPGEVYFAPYCYDRGRQFRMLGGKNMRYFYMDWYQVPKELGRAVWSEPYFDEGGGDIVMATYSVPFYGREDFGKDLMGIVTADVSLTWLEEIVRAVKIFRTGYAFLVTRNGTFITHPDSELVMNESIFSLAEEIDNPRLREIGRAMIRGDQGFTPFVDPLTGQESFLSYTPFPSSGWSMGVVFPKDELMADIRQLRNQVFVLGGVGVLILATALILIARSISRPLVKLRNQAGAIAAGNLDESISLKKAGEDEVGQLARSFEHMRVSLKDFIRELTDTTAAKERIQSELMIARDIQFGILPKIFPAFPERAEFDVFATIDPAREVGGDFYTFFFLDETRFCFIIGDVSDKGVPAALFMAVTTTLFKAKANIHRDPGEILALVNNDLAPDNDSAMFVTVFLGILDTETGKVTYANGGHNPPLILRAGGEVEVLPIMGNPALGAMEDMPYDCGELFLAQGDVIFTYTDGVTEAMDPDKQLYSEKRLAKVLAGCKGEKPEHMICCVMKDIRAFAQGEDQSDDITMLALMYSGKKG